jgi:predicted alpha/beta hydrolase
MDVWLGNMRGNQFSHEHKIYKDTQREYWQFSFDQMSQYDLDAQINKVLNVTQQKSLYYVGHSQGTLTMFSKLSIDPDFQQKVYTFSCPYKD